MRLENVKGSNNFLDHTVWGAKDYFNDFMFRLLYPAFRAMGRQGSQIDPSVNDEYIRRAKSYGKTDLKDSITNYTPEEIKLIRDNGFGLNDIRVMREYKKLTPAQREQKYRLEEDGSVSRK